MATSDYVEEMYFLNGDKYSLGQKYFLSLPGTWLFVKTSFPVSYCNVQG